MTTETSDEPYAEADLAAWRATFRRVLDGLPPSMVSKPHEEMTGSERDLLKQFRQLRLLTRSANGMALDVEQEALEHWDHARAVYRHWLTEIERAGASCRIMKGFDIAGLYPGGWVRTSGDLDLFAPTDDDLWRAGEVLVAGGWHVMCGALVAAEDGPGVIVPFERSCPACDGLLEIELRGLACFGDPLRMRARRHFPAGSADGGSVQIVPLLEEAFQRAHTTRDVFDAWLVTRHWPDGTMAVVDDLDLWPEYAGLVEAATRIGAPPLPAPPDLAARRRAVTRDRRRHRAAHHRRRSGWSHLLGRGLRRAPGGRLQELASRLVEGLADPATVYADGLPLWGRQLDTTPRPFALRAGDGTFGVDSPLGRFGFTHAPALVVGSEEVDLVDGERR
jgi:hypothetical protein